MTQQSDKINRYKIVSKLCSGGMADIFLGIQLDQQVLERFVVIKKIRNVADATPETKGMFADEARIVSTLNHPHVVQIFDFKEKKDHFHIIMEYIDGENLGFILNSQKRKNKRIPLDVGLRLIIQALEALQYIHSATSRAGKPLDIVHRDLDPRNLMLDANGYLKIIDFGVAKAAVQTELTCPGLFKGKLSHVAPEMFTQSGVDSRADIYSIGLVLFEIATGERPYQFGKNPVLAETIKTIIGDPIPTPSSINSDIPEELEEIILKACSKNREERYQTADELHIALMQFAHGGENSCGVASNAEVKNWFVTEFSERLKKRRIFENTLLQKAKQSLEGRPSRPSSIMPPLPESDKSGISSIASGVSTSGGQISGFDSASNIPLAEGLTANSSNSAAIVRITPPPPPTTVPYSTLPPPSFTPPYSTEELSTSGSFNGSTPKRFLKFALAAAAVTVAASATLLFFWRDALPWSNNKIIASNSKININKQIATNDPTITTLDAITVNLNEGEDEQPPVQLEPDAMSHNPKGKTSVFPNSDNRKKLSPQNTVLPEKTASPPLNRRWTKYKTRALQREKLQEAAVSAELEKTAVAEEADSIEPEELEMLDETEDIFNTSPVNTTTNEMPSASGYPIRNTEDSKNHRPAPPQATPSQKQNDEPQFISGSGNWNGPKVALRGCGSCHAVDATTKTTSQWKYFFSHNRHRRNGNLKALFSSAELRRVESHLISVVERSKTNNSGIAGIR